MDGKNVGIRGKTYRASQKGMLRKKKMIVKLFHKQILESLFSGNRFRDKKKTRFIVNIGLKCSPWKIFVSREWRWRMSKISSSDVFVR